MAKGGVQQDARDARAGGSRHDRPNPRRARDTGRTRVHLRAVPARLPVQPRQVLEELGGLRNVEEQHFKSRGGRHKGEP